MTIADRIDALLAKQTNRDHQDDHLKPPVEQGLRKIEDQLALTVGLLKGTQDRSDASRGPTAEDIRGALLALVDAMAQLTDLVRDHDTAIDEAASAVQLISERASGR